MPKIELTWMNFRFTRPSSCLCWGMSTCFPTHSFLGLSNVAVSDRNPLFPAFPAALSAIGEQKHSICSLRISCWAFIIRSISANHSTTRLTGQLASRSHHSFEDEALPNESDYATFTHLLARGLGPGESSFRKRTGVGSWGWESTFNYLERREIYMLLP